MSKHLAILTLILTMSFTHFLSTAQQDNVLILYNSSWGAQGTFNCVQSYAGAAGNFTLCPIPNGNLIAAPACVTNLCSYDIVMVQSTYTSLNAAFMAQLIAYLQCGGNLYFQNDVGSGSSVNQQQNMNDLLAAISQPPIVLNVQSGSFQNQQPVIDVGTSGITNLCTITPLNYNSGGMLTGPGLANAATVTIPQGTIAAFWQTGYGGILGLGGEFYTSGNWAGSCLPGSGEMVWGFMSTVNPGCLTILADFVPSAFNLCENDSIFMTDVSVSDSIVQWDWIFTGGIPATSSVQNPTGITYANVGTYDITLTITDSSGVTDDTTLQITVTQCDPFASFSVIDTVCAGTAFTVTDLSTSLTGIQSWNWTIPGGNPASSNLQDPGNIVYNTSGNYNITLDVIDANGTDDTTITVVVVDCNPPIAIFSVPPDTLCPNDCITVVDMSTSDSPIISWFWNFSNGTPGASNLQNPGTICYPTAGTHPITLTVTNANGSHDTTFYVIVQPNPVANFTIAPLNPITDESVTFTNQSTGEVSSEWNINGVYYTTENPMTTFNESGTYPASLLVTSSAGCTDTITHTFSIVEELIYYVPNAFTPDGDEYNNTFKPIFYSGFDPYDYKLLIFNRWGEIIFESNNPEIGWDGSYQKSQDGLVQDGIYTWSIEFRVLINDERKSINGHVTILR